MPEETACALRLAEARLRCPLAAHCSGWVFRVEKSRDSDQGPGPLRAQSCRGEGQPWQPEARRAQRARRYRPAGGESERLYSAARRVSPSMEPLDNRKMQKGEIPTQIINTTSARNLMQGPAPNPGQHPGIRLSPSGNTWAVTGATGQYAVVAGQPTPPGTAGLKGRHKLPLQAAVRAVGGSGAGHHFITGHWSTSPAPSPLGKERGWDPSQLPCPRCSPGIFLPGTPSPLVGSQLQCDGPAGGFTAQPTTAPSAEVAVPLPGPREHSCPSRSPQSSFSGRAQRTGASLPASFTRSAQRSEPRLLLLLLSGLF